MFLIIQLSACIFEKSKPAHPMSKYELVSQDAKQVKLEPSDEYTLLSFIFTRCAFPTMCPLTVKLNQDILKIWQALPDKERPKLRFLLVTLDPEYDTPQTLKDFATVRKIDLENIQLWTGERETLVEFASEFNVIGLPNRTGIIAHNIKTILLAPDLSEVEQFKENEWQPSDVINKLKEHATSQKTS